MISKGTVWCTGILVFLTCGSAALAAGLNTNVALTPPTGGSIVRTQWRYSEFSPTDNPGGTLVRLSVNPVTFVHGMTASLAVLATVPIVRRSITGLGAGRDRGDTGLGDITLLAKYRFQQKDGPGRTTRWAVIGGAEVPAGDDVFSSDTVDPVLGTVWTHQRLNWWLDWDVVYKANTGGGAAGYDLWRGDVAVSRRLWSGPRGRLGPWAFYAVGEANGQTDTAETARVFLSPGVQFISAQWIFEAGVQVPVHQETATGQLPTDFTTVLSGRFQF